MGTRQRLALCAAGLLFVAGCAGRWPWQTPPPPPQPEVAAKPPPVAHAPARRPPKFTTAGGPLKSAMVGGYMDAQEKDFRARLHGVPVMRVGDDIVVLFHNDVIFKGEALSGRGRDFIQRLAELLRHYDRSAVQVGGYTDTAQPEDRNRALTDARAKSVAGQLVSDGVGKERVTATGYGSSHPKISTGPGKDEPRNRRIEIRIIAHPDVG